MSDDRALDPGHHPDVGDEGGGGQHPAPPAGRDAGSTPADAMTSPRPGADPAEPAPGTVAAVVDAAREFARAQAAWREIVERGEKATNEVAHRRAAATATLLHYVNELGEDSPGERLAAANAELKAEVDELRTELRRQALQALSDEGQYEENYQARLKADADMGRLRTLVYMLYRTLYDGPIDELPGLAPEGKELLAQVVEQVKTQTHTALDKEPSPGDAG